MLQAGIDHDAIVEHYTVAAPLLVKHFGSIPFGWMEYPDGFAGRGAYLSDTADLPPPHRRVDVQTAAGTRPFVALSETVLPWLARAKGAVDVLSWTPASNDPTRPAFGHITLTPSGTATDDDVFAAARALRSPLMRSGITAFCVLDGFRGLTMWLSVPREYTFEWMGTLMHSVVRDALRDLPDLLAHEQLKAERGNRVAVGTDADYPGRGVLLPYAVRGTPGLEVAWPTSLEDLGAVRNGDVRVENFAAVLARDGDVFARLAAAHGPSKKPSWQLKTAPFRCETVLAATSTLGPARPCDVIVRAALSVLAGDAARSATWIRDSAVERGLLPGRTTPQYVDAVLHEYALRTFGAGRKPPLARVPSSAEFRLSGAADVWPEIALPPAPQWLDDATVDELSRRLELTSTGSDPAAFEAAVCDVFAALGFLTQRIGGEGEPAGIVDAPLADDGWRGVIACRTARPGSFVEDLRLDELTRFCSAYGAVRSALVGPVFENYGSVVRELQAQKVSLWSVGDLRTALRVRIGPADAMPAFEPGIAQARIESIVYRRAMAEPKDVPDRDDGEPEHVAAAARAVAECGWAAQERLARAYAPAESPRLNRERLLLLVDDALDSIDPTIEVTRETLDAAIERLLARGFATTSGSGMMKRVLISAPVRLEVPKATRSTPLEALPPHVDPDDIWDACRCGFLERSGLPGDAALVATFPVLYDIQWHGLEHSIGCENTGPAALRAASAGYRFLGVHDAADSLDAYLAIAEYTEPADAEMRGSLPEPLDEATRERIQALEERYCDAARDDVMIVALKAAMARHRDAFTRISGGVYALAKARWDR